MEVIVFLGLFALVAVLAFWAGLSNRNFIFVFAAGIIAAVSVNDIALLSFFVLYLSIWSRIFHIE